MPISSFLATSAVAKPGVCLSTTRPASPYEGQVIYETDTDKTLVWNGTAWVFLSTGTASQPGLELVKTQTIGSAVASVECTSAFSSTYDNYYVSATDVSFSANQPDVKLTLGATVTGYSYGGFYMGHGVGTLTALNGNNTTHWVIATAGNATASSFAFSLMTPNLAKNTFISSSSASQNWSETMNGYLNNTTQYTAFTITPSNGTLTGGTIRVYGYRNS